jgi:hypothetical protein
MMPSAMINPAGLIRLGRVPFLALVAASSQKTQNTAQAISIDVPTVVMP